MGVTDSSLQCLYSGEGSDGGLVKEGVRGQSGEENGGETGSYVMALDGGTTTIRSMVYNSQGRGVGTATTPVQYLQGDGKTEIEPDLLWEDCLSVLQSSLLTAGLAPEDIKGIGLSCQRASFTCWSALTGKPLFPLITWQDIRANAIVRDWNSSLYLKAF